MFLTSSTQKKEKLSTKKNHSYIRSFNRFELKYHLHYEQASHLLNLIKPYIKQDTYNIENGFYRIVTLYYDSPEFFCFWEKLDGFKFRRKVRIRLYDDTPDRAFLEIKQRIDRTIQKRRILGNRNEIIQYLDLWTPKGDDYLSGPVYEEALNLVYGLHLEPQIIVSYNREAYFGVYESGLRITFDRNLCFEKYHDKFCFKRGNSKYFMKPWDVILEVKFNEVVPTWLCSALNSMNFEISRISKYCHAINKAVFNGSLL